MKCEICRKEPNPSCDWNQGRCPHRKPMFNIQPKDTSKGHFYVSLAKSSLRIVAGICVIMAVLNLDWLIAVGTLLIAAEALGIVEEMV